MILGIPTLCRYDLLKRLFRTTEAGSVCPTKYIIVDNGGALPEEELRAFLGPRKHVLEVIRPGRNIGVAASWNLIIDRAAPEPVIISNDDILFYVDTFEELIWALVQYRFVEGDGWALFGQRHELVQSVGYYDENFWPAYYEDVDYDLRLARAGVPIGRPLSRPVHHEGWATEKALGQESWLREGRERNHAYFIAKWGGESRNPRWNGTPDIVHFKEPFDGKPPAGWSERKAMSESLVAMRWDVLNAVVERIGATRYLEIGVNNGECLTKVNVYERWGVDPNANGLGVTAPDLVIPRTSQVFFEKIAPYLQQRFDLIFLDGDHRAELVYDEIQAAKKLLSPRGVICLHDCNPHSEEMQEVPLRSGHLWTGDVWKTVARIRNEAEFECRVVPFDYGTGVLVPARRSVRQASLPCSWDRLLWKDLVADRENLLGLLRPDDWKDWVARATE
jgi:GT2 family glycosyltransferase